MRAVEASYEKNKERWVDTLFSLIVGVQREKRGETYGALSAKIRASTASACGRTTLPGWPAEK